MTDNEIIKALDCFSGKEIYCKNCAYRDNSNMGICRRNAAKDTIDLINRQKAEIERLKGWQDLLKAEKHSLIKAEAVKEFLKKAKDLSYESRDWSHGEHPFVVELDDLETIYDEMRGEG